MITTSEARAIAAGWISPGATDLTAFATGHPRWTVEGLVSDVEEEMRLVRVRPAYFDDPAQCTRELAQLLEFARSFTGGI
jgi:hypothetical protein